MAAESDKPISGKCGHGPDARRSEVYPQGCYECVERFERIGGWLMFWLWYYNLYQVSMHHYEWTGHRVGCPRTDDGFLFGILERVRKAGYFRYHSL